MNTVFQKTLPLLLCIPITYASITSLILVSDTAKNLNQFAKNAKDATQKFDQAAGTFNGSVKELDKLIIPYKGDGEDGLAKLLARIIEILAEPKSTEAK